MPAQSSLPSSQAPGAARRLRWWRLASALFASALAGVWFIRYPRPEPGGFQKGLFFFLLFLILLEAAQAGWYQTQRARETLAKSRKGQRADESPTSLQALGIVLLVGGFLALFWGALGQPLLSSEIGFLPITGGILGIFFGGLLILNPAKQE